VAVERLAFEDASTSYHSYHAAQHVVRYATVKDIVAGKRVLDVACGEGYGVRLLLEWGAREVVGVEISPAAVATAKRQFGGEGATFLVGDAEALGKVLDGVEPFDLVVSFETVEHLARPDDFLAYLPGLLAPGGAIAISCPNDPAHVLGDQNNPFHMREYRFDEFRSLTERHLGKASMWLLGAPLLGEMNYRPGDDFVEAVHDGQCALLDTRAIGNALVIPAQSNLTTSDAQCSHYIGIWGAEVSPNAVISSLPVQEYVAPWRQNAHLASQLAAHERRQSEHFEPEIARLTEANARLEVLHASAAAELERSAERQRSALEEAAAERAMLATSIRQQFEPEIERLKAEAVASHRHIARLEDENSRVLTENAECRGELKAMAANAAELEERLAQARAAVESAMVEKAAMATRISDLFEPRIERLAGQVSTLERDNERLAALNEQLQAGDRELELERAMHVAGTEELAAATATLQQLKDKIARWYEPELARLQTHVEHSKFEKETQLLRRRVMAYADQARRIGATVVELEAQIAQHEHVRDSWYVPELERLSGIIEQHEETKREWFEPQLNARSAHIAALEEEIRIRDGLIDSLQEKNAGEAKSPARIFQFKR
jgi:2-polyprenyl-3-methyl-5-hydroxy-6-metoxy-1,4-benzoquinol methylase